jgi:hypothetical protein
LQHEAHLAQLQRQQEDQREIDYDQEEEQHQIDLDQQLQIHQQQELDHILQVMNHN